MRAEVRSTQERHCSEHPQGSIINSLIGFCVCDTLLKPGGMFIARRRALTGRMSSLAWVAVQKLCKWHWPLADKQLSLPTIWREAKHSIFSDNTFSLVLK